jgi:hypothetical protein
MHLFSGSLAEFGHGNKDKGNPALEGQIKESGLPCLVLEMHSCRIFAVMVSIMETSEHDFVLFEIHPLHSYFSPKSHFLETS